MAPISMNKEERQVDVLEQVAGEIRRRERRERICHRVIAGLALLAFAAFACGHAVGRGCHGRHCHL